MDAKYLRQLDRKIAERLGWRIKEIGINAYKQKLYHVWTPEGKQVGYWEGINDPRYTHNIVELTLENYQEAVPVGLFPHYTTDLNAAWELAKEAQLVIYPTFNGWSAARSLNRYIIDGGIKIDREKMYGGGGACGDADTPALAICYAWLSWKHYTTEETQS